MVSKEVVISNPSGLHLRPASVLCKQATGYRSRIFLRFNDYEANAKSVISVLAAGVKTGDAVTLVCDGGDEAEALEGMMQVITDGLGEL